MATASAINSCSGYNAAAWSKLKNNLMTLKSHRNVYDSSTIVSDSVEPEEESLVLRGQVPHLDDVITLDSSDNIEQLDHSGTRPIIE